MVPALPRTGGAMRLMVPRDSDPGLLHAKRIVGAQRLRSLGHDQDPIVLPTSRTAPSRCTILTHRAVFAIEAVDVPDLDL